MQQRQRRQRRQQQQHSSSSSNSSSNSRSNGKIAARFSAASHVDQRAEQQHWRCGCPLVASHAPRSRTGTAAASTRWMPARTHGQQHAKAASEQQAERAERKTADDRGTSSRNKNSAPTRIHLYFFLSFVLSFLPSFLLSFFPFFLWCALTRANAEILVRTG